MNLFEVSQPIGYVFAVLGVHPAQRRDDRGASAVEWVLISALVVGIAISVGLLLKNALETSATNVGNQIKDKS